MKSKKSGRRESILVLCAHSDDQILGVGGAIAKFAKEGKEVNIVIFSYGEKSHPWLKKHVIADIRIKESEQASNIVGAKQTIFFNMEEGKFKEDFDKKRVAQRLEKLVKQFKPTKIFTHSPDDPLPDHKSVSNLVLNFCKKIKFKGDVYSFDVWNTFNRKTGQYPKMVVDITKTFGTKLKALKVFQSQKIHAIAVLIGVVYWRAIKNGLWNHCRFAEVFYKIY